MLEIRKTDKYIIFILLFLVSIFGYGIEKICGFTMYPDEFGYWASAAKAAGYDWSEVASLGSFYSFGYSLILIPILKLFHGGIISYRVAVAVNFLFMCISLFLLTNIMKSCFPRIGKSRKSLVSGIAVLYPPYIFYSQMTLAESLLFLLFTLLTWLFVRLVISPNIITVVLFIFVLIYMYSVHMRTVGIMIACIITLFLWGINNPSIRKWLLLMGAILLFAGIVLLVIKRNVISQVFAYADSTELSVNDYGSQWNKIVDIFSFKGMASLVVEFAGKVFYLGFASFGIFFFAMTWAVKELYGLFYHIRKKEYCPFQNWLGSFLFLSVLGELLISSIYMHGSAKVDCLIYGRYNEFMMPVFMVFGIAVMFRSRHLFRDILIYCAAGGLTVPFLNFFIKKNQMEGIRGYFVPGISYFLDEKSFVPSQFLWKAWMLGCISAVVIALIIRASKKTPKAGWVISIAIVAEILFGLQISDHYTYQVNEVLFSDLIISDIIKRESEEKDRIVYLDEGKPPFIDFQQMQLCDKSIHVIKEEDIGKSEDLGRFLIISDDSLCKEELQAGYDRQVNSSSFILYYRKEFGDK